MIRRDRQNDSGVALLNVLVVAAIGAALVQGMLLAQSGAISNTSDTADRAQALALAKGGIASVRTGLRRDMTQSPEADHLGELWAQAAQTPVRFGFGGYSVDISDAQGRFNLNTLRSNGVAEMRVFGTLLATLDLPPELALQIARIVARRGSLSSPKALELEGIDRRSLVRLTPFVVCIGKDARINLNAASELVLTALFSNAAAAKSLLARRSAKGFLDHSDLAAFGLALPLMAGFQSNTYDVRVAASVGSITHNIHRRIQRFPKTGKLIEKPLD